MGKCIECNMGTEDTLDTCQECCEHIDMDDGYCLLCGKDRTEEMMSLAYDRYKDRMKYGD